MNTKSCGFCFSIVLLLAVAIAGMSGLVSTPAAAGGAQVEGGKGKCIGISTERIGLTVVRVYRIFEDGTLEIMDNGEGETGQWLRLGK